MRRTVLRFLVFIHLYRASIAMIRSCENHARSLIIIPYYSKRDKVSMRKSRRQDFTWTELPALIDPSNTK